MSDQLTHKPEPIFKHRLDSTKVGDINAVTDAIHLMTDRALGVLYLLTSQFEGHGSRMNDQLVNSAIHAAIAEIEDIDSVLLAHYDAEK
jgi:hypothetical protein